MVFISGVGARAWFLGRSLVLREDVATIQAAAKKGRLGVTTTSSDLPAVSNASFCTLGLPSARLPSSPTMAIV